MAGSDGLRHIPIERIRLVVAKCDQFLTEDETEHLGKCVDCLDAFSTAVLSEPEYGYGRDNEEE
jgi:epoxyqueuosine reductase QueG